MISDKFLRVVITLLGVVPTLTLIATYSLTIAQNHTSRIIPYISTSIDYAPESCIGTLGLTVTAFLAYVAVLVKYLHVSALLDNHGASSKITTSQSATFRFHNLIAFVIGNISLLGLIGVASFQYHHVPVVHLTFAVVYFFGAGVYMILMSSLERRIEQSNLWTYRTVLAWLSIFVFFPATIPALWGYDNLSAAFEITNAAIIFAYFLTYYRDFSNIQITISVVDRSYANVSIEKQEPMH